MDAVYAVAVQVDIPKLMSDAVKRYKTCKMKKSFLMPLQQFLQQRIKGFYNCFERRGSSVKETCSEKLCLLSGVDWCPEAM